MDSQKFEKNYATSVQCDINDINRIQAVLNEFKEDISDDELVSEELHDHRNVEAVNSTTSCKESYGHKASFITEDDTVIPPTDQPPTSSLCLQYIRDIQKSISVCHAKLQDLTINIEQKEFHLKEALAKSASKEADNKLRKRTKAVSVFAAPYFRDTRKRMHPPNEDSIMKRKNHDVDAYTEPPRPWSDIEYNLLYEAVTANAMRAEIDPLNASKDYYLDKLRSEDFLPEEIGSIKDKIKSIEEEIKKAKETPLEECISLDRKLDWMRISAHNPNLIRADEECELIWTNYLHPSINKKKWTKEEDQELLAIAKRHSFRDWESIAREFTLSKRTTIQCFERYQSHLNKSMVKSSWSPEDDEELRNIVEGCRVGNHIPWSQVCYFIDGRTRNQLTNRWYRSLYPQRKKGSWSQEEDTILLAVVAKFGTAKWVTVTRFLPGRSALSCRERYTNYLQPGMKTGNWTKEEDQILVNAVRKYGEGKWTQVSKLLPGRNDNMCLHRGRRIKKYCPSIFEDLPVDDPSTIEMAGVPSNRRSISGVIRNNIFANAEKLILDSLMKIKGYKTPEEAQAAPIGAKSSIKVLTEMSKHILAESTDPQLSSSSVIKTEVDDPCENTHRAIGRASVGRRPKSAEEAAVDKELDLLIGSSLVCGLRKRKKRSFLYQTASCAAEHRAVRSTLCEALCFEDTLSEEETISSSIVGIDHTIAVASVFKNLIFPECGHSEVPVFPPNRANMESFKHLLTKRKYLESLTFGLKGSDITTMQSIINRGESPTLECSSCKNKKAEVLPTHAETDLDGTGEIDGTISLPCDKCNNLNKIGDDFQLLRKRFHSLFFWPAILTFIQAERDQKEKLISSGKPQNRLVKRNTSRKRKRKNTWLRKNTSPKAGTSGSSQNVVKKEKLKIPSVTSSFPVRRSSRLKVKTQRDYSDD